MRDTAQLALFLRDETPMSDIVEEFVRLVSMKDTATEANVFESVRKSTTETNLDLSNLIGVTTDGTPTMTGEKKGFVALLQKHIGDKKQLYKLHCIVHQDQLCAKSMKFKEIVAVVIKTVNFIISRELNHRQFQEFLRETEAEFRDLWSNLCGSTVENAAANICIEKRDYYFLDSWQQDSSHFLNAEWLVDFLR